MGRATEGESARRKGLAARIFASRAGYLFVFLGLGFLLLRFDLFGLTSLLKNYSQDLLSMAIARCYPGGKADGCAAAGSTNGKPGGKPPVAVVLLTESDLEALEAPWPLTYDLHASVLQAIRANEPRALAIDIVFEDERSDPTIEALEDELERYEEDGIPVYAGSFGRPLRSRIREHVRPVPVPKRVDHLDRVTRLYDLHHGEDGDRQKTMAFEVFAALCPGGDADADAIRLFWQAPPAEGTWNRRWLDCRPPLGLTDIVFPRTDEDFRADCPTTPTIPVRLLLESSEGDGLAIEKLLRGAVVLYGTHFTGAVDVLNTPLHNDLPGVFLHATALENLITFGPEPLRYESHEIPWLGVGWPDLIFLVAIGLASTFVRRGDGYVHFKEAIEAMVPFRVGGAVKAVLGSQAGLLLLMVLVASLFACRLPSWFFGINFLFAITWTELLEISEKLFEAEEKLEH